MAHRRDQRFDEAYKKGHDDHHYKRLPLWPIYGVATFRSPSISLVVRVKFRTWSVSFYRVDEKFKFLRRALYFYFILWWISIAEYLSSGWKIKVLSINCQLINQETPPFTFTPCKLLSPFSEHREHSFFHYVAFFTSIYLFWAWDLFGHRNHRHPWGYSSNILYK